MVEQAMETSYPRARLIGFVYLLYFLSSVAGGFALKDLVLSTDAAATADNILANQRLYQLGVSLGLVGNVFYLALTALFFHLFSPVGPRAALVAAFCGLAGCIVQLFGGIFQLAPLVLVKDSHLFSVLQQNEVRAAVMLCFKMYNQVYSISFPLFAFFMIHTGWLIIRSTFLPRIIGIFWMCAGLISLTFLWPPSLWLPAATAATVSGFIFPLDGVAEVSLLLWLLVIGVNVAKWRTVTRA
ncbi:MAG: DUF4386 domain-containing protein [Proteobacteria bacterium]|nr:DUF4386 domain-containing protein [Pseudomonadota bacterium]